MIAVRAVAKIAELRALCPTVDSPQVSLEFEEMWQTLVDRPWRAGQENVLGVRGLNREVADTASGREGEEYVREALANIARCKARWTEIPTEREWQALESVNPSEVGWLEFLISRRSEHAVTELLADWKPSTEGARRAKTFLIESLKGGERSVFPNPPSSVDSPDQELLATAFDIAIEFHGLQMAKSGRWKGVRDGLSGVPGLFASAYRLGAELHNQKLGRKKRQAIETELSRVVYYLERLAQRFEIHGWRRAFGLQKEIIETVTERVRIES